MAINKSIFRSSPRRMWPCLYGATKSLETYSHLCSSMPVKRQQEHIWQLVKRTSGQTNVSMQWTGNIWSLLSRSRRICTRFGGPSNIRVSAVQGSMLTATPVLVRYSQTRGVQFAAKQRAQYTLCSASMKTALDY